jgi:hypothetical protein
MKKYILLFLFISVGVFAQIDVGDIPADILSKYDPKIVSGERPVVVRISRDMIDSLPSNPDLGGDVYSFDLDKDTLTSSQTGIIREWVRAGNDVLLWGLSDAFYLPLFNDSWFPATYYHITQDEVRATLSNHPVNTGVEVID